MATRLPSWRLPDIIDYECFLNADDREAPEALHGRDRAFFLEAIEPALPPADPNAKRKKNAAERERRAVLHGWLNCRRQLELKRAGASSGQEVIMPGEAFSQIFTTTRWWLLILGLLIGWGMATAALSYSAGAEPINAFTFFVGFAVIQMVILLGAFAVLAVRHWFPNWKIPSLMRLLLRLAAGAARNLWRKNRVRIAGSSRQNAEAVFGILKARNTLYGSIFVWSLVLLTQAFAISFNVGALGAMTARHLFHDLDFGWESTWLNADEISRGVKIAATPWSWAVHPGHPSAEQVLKSQNHKRESGKLDAESLKSWSNFLFGAVVCYGLLPRLALLLFAARAQRGALKRLRFGDGRSAQLINRLRTPTVQTHGLRPAGSLAWAPESGAAIDARPMTGEPPGSRLTQIPLNVPPSAAAPAYWPQVPSAAPMSPVSSGPAAPAFKTPEPMPHATDSKSAAASVAQPTTGSLSATPAKVEPATPVRPPIPAPHPRPPLVPPSTTRVVLPSNPAASNPSPAASPNVPPISPPTVAKANAAAAFAPADSKPLTVVPPAPSAKAAPVSADPAPKTPAASPAVAAPLSKAAPATVAPLVAPVNRSPVAEPVKTAPITPTPATPPPAPVPTQKAAPAPTKSLSQAPVPTPAAVPTRASSLETAARPPLPPISTPVLAPVPAAAPAPAASTPARAFATAEPLLILNLTGRPFAAEQAVQTVGRSQINGATAPATVFEAGTLSLEQDEQSFAVLKQRAASLPDAEVFALIPSWTAPMIASKLLIDQLRASVGRDRLISLILVGRPAPDGSFKPVRPSDRTLWTTAAQARGDAYLSLI